MPSKTILVNAANGNVGSSLARILLDQGYKVNALVRNVDSDIVHDLKKRGANIVKGNFDDIDSLRKASEGIWGVFINAYPVPNTLDELRHNKNVITVAKEAGAKFGIYMSVILAERKDQFSGWDQDFPNRTYWESKYSSELALQQAGFDYWAIFRPGVFITSFFSRLADVLWPQFQKDHLLATTANLSVTFPFVDVDVIAKYVATAFADPNTFNGLAVDLASEEASLEQFAQKVTEVLGIQINVEYIGKEEAAARNVPGVIGDWAQWIDELNYQVDYKRLDTLPADRGSIVGDLLAHKKEYIKFLTQ